MTYDNTNRKNLREAEKSAKLAEAIGKALLRNEARVPIKRAVRGTGLNSNASMSRNF